MLFLKYILSTLLLVVMYLSPQKTVAQELFPYAEAASALPKRSFSYRISTEYFTDLQSNFKNWYAFRAMYGVTKNITAIATVSGSNHHVKNFPNGYAAYFLNHHSQYSSRNPFTFEGLHLYLKYRVAHWDGQQQHVRLALYGEGSISDIAHDEAEPNLMGDNAGLGGGGIATALYRKLALSVTAGVVKPKPYYDTKSEVTFTSGDMFLINASAGYLLFPKQYKGYSDISVSLYSEFIYRNYQVATLAQRVTVFDLTNYTLADRYTFNSLQAGQYCDLRTSLQFVFNAQSRIDLGVVWRLWNRSYVHTYPMLALNYQRYVFGKQKRGEKFKK